MNHPVVHFAVYADDPQRAIAFYSAVFGWRFEPWGPPGYWLLYTGPNEDHVAGALSRRTAPMGEGEPNAYRCTISVPDVDATCEAIERAGGRLRPPVTDIPGVGRVVEFVDPEGNRVCAMQYADGDPRAVR